MTEKQLRQYVADTINGWLGFSEANGKFRQIIDIYNRHTPRARGYAVKYTDEWCATTVSAVSIELGLTDIMPTECSCSKMIELYKKLGRWQERDDYRPQIGDVIMYYWKDSATAYATTDCKEPPNHVGIVTAISGDLITVTEGNKGEAVAKRSMKVNGRFIRGYCLPDYAKAASKAPVEPAVDTHSQAAQNTTPVRVDVAQSKDARLTGVYSVKAVGGLYLRRGVMKEVIKCMPNGSKVRCYGFYTQHGNTKWLLVQTADGSTGFCSGNYLKRREKSSRPFGREPFILSNNDIRLDAHICPCQNFSVRNSGSVFLFHVNILLFRCARLLLRGYGQSDHSSHFPALR